MAKVRGGDGTAGHPPWIGLAALGALLIASAGIALDRLIAKQSGQFVLAALLQAAVYVAAVWWIARHGVRPGMTVVALIVAVVVRAVALPAPPFLSTDAYRYVWDGRVQASGVNPYRYVPSDPTLAPLRDTAIYPNINRREYAPTIYPPAGQVIFLIVTRFGETLLTMKLAMMAFEAVAMLALAMFLKRRGQPTSRVLIYAWHPLPVWEFAGTGHLDAAAIAFICLSLVAADRKWSALTGLGLAAGALVKPFPFAIAPALWRRWDWKMPVAALLIAAILYAPYVGVGSKVLGFLGGYGDEEDYDEGSGFYLVALLRALGLPAPSGVVYLAAGLVVFGGLAAAITFRPNPQDLRSADPIVLGSAFLLLTSPHYAWYFSWVIPLLCSALYPPLLYMTLASFMIYLPRDTFLGSRFVVDSVIYGGFVLLALTRFGAGLAWGKGGKDE
jgi:alpha-1,6-mannosyltransferase